MKISQTCFNQASMVKFLGLFVSITSIEEPTNDFMHVTSDIRFESQKVSHNSDK